MSSSFLVSGFGVTISKRNSVTVGEETQAKNIVEVQDSIYPSIDNVSTLFKSGDFQQLETYLISQGNDKVLFLRLSTFRKFSLALRDIDPTGVTFRVLRQQQKFVDDMLTGLERTFNVYLDKQYLEEQYEEERKYRIILTTPELLLEWIHTQQASTLFFNPSINTIAATIDPEYQYYIATYGFPSDGVFDSNLFIETLRAIQQPENFATYGFASQAEAQSYVNTKYPTLL